MGDYFTFDCQEVGGIPRNGFYFQTKESGYHGVFVQFSGEQEKQANDWQLKMDALMQEQEDLIKSWIKGKGE